MNSMFDHFNWVDYTILGIILFSTLISLFRGFMREIVSLIIWIIGVILAFKFSPILQPHFVKWFSSETVSYFIAFIAIFSVAFFVGILINIMVHSFVQNVGFTLTDRVLGLCFGVARGILIIGIVFMFMGVGGDKTPSSIKESALVVHFQPLVNWLNGFLPEQFRQLSKWVKENRDEATPVEER